MKTLVKTALIGLAATTSAPVIAAPIMFEESMARAEEQKILSSPIAGIYNSLWFDYRIDVIEAQKELKSDLRRATDTEDMRDAWDEYATELRHERRDYVKDMAKRGYRSGTVIIEG